MGGREAALFVINRCSGRTVISADPIKDTVS
jgi:hypothetical protein